MSCQEVAEQEGLQIIFIKIENEFEKALVQCATLVAWWLSRKLQLLEGIYILSHHGHAQWEHFLHCCTSLVIIKVVRLVDVWDGGPDAGNVFMAILG